MKKIKIIILLLLLGVFVFLKPSFAEDLSSKLKGRILLQIEENGEAFYVHPVTSKLHYMANGKEAYNIMRSSGVGINNKDLNKIPVALNFIEGLEKLDSDNDGYDDKLELQKGYDPYGPGIYIDQAFTNKHKGKIFIQVESHGEAWYISPSDGLRYYLGTPSVAFNIMRSLGLGITNKDIRSMDLDILENNTKNKNQNDDRKPMGLKLETLEDFLEIPTDENYFPRARLPEKFDVNKINNQVIDSEKQSIIDDPRFSIPTSVINIKMMSENEKKELGLEQYEDVQVLTLEHNGPIVGYQIIRSEEDFVIDLY